jgi:peroxiredoxin
VWQQREREDREGLPRKEGRALIEEGDLAPDEIVTTPDGESVDLRGPALPLVIFFCRDVDSLASGQLVDDFQEHHAQFDDVGVRLMGVGVDGPELTAAFAAAHGLQYTLIDDVGRTLCRAFGVMEHTGHHRPHPSTFLIDTMGVVRQVFPAIPPYGHASDVLEEARALWG